MQIDVITIFPEMFAPVLGVSMLKRAQEQGQLLVRVHDLRDFTHDKRRTVDDRPYGGGPGMIMKPEPMFEAVETIQATHCPGHARIYPTTALGSGVGAPGSGPSRTELDDTTGQLPRAPSPEPRATLGFGTTSKKAGCHTILMSPAGEPLTSACAEALAKATHLMIICGHYEGVDERVKSLVSQSMSIGDYVLTGGELPALVLIDAVARFIPGVIGHAQATDEESFAGGWLEYPQYTRPPVFRGMAVPEVLLSGDHGEIAQWRRLQAVERTAALRPDLMRDGSSGTPDKPGSGSFGVRPQRGG